MADEVIETTGSPFDDPPRPLFDTPRVVPAGAGQSGAGQPGADDRPPGDSGSGVPRDRRFEGRLALVTGASGLIGAAMVEELARCGARVLLVGHDAPSLREVVADLDVAASCAVLECDLTESSDVVAAVDFVRRLDRPVELVVHAAGLHAASTIARGPVEQLDEHYLLNVRGPYLLTQQLLPMLADDVAQCVFFTTPPSSSEDGGDAHHAIAAAAVTALADELRREARHRGIRVVTVETSEQPPNALTHVDRPTFGASLASTVVDALSNRDLAVTELSVRSLSHAARSEQR